MLTTTAAEAETHPRTLLDVIEIASCSPSRRRPYFYIILAITAFFFLMTVARCLNLWASASGRHLIDFDVFYIAGQLTWRGELEKAYYSADMARIQLSISGHEDFALWTYPPQFALFVAPLALLPVGLAYGLLAAGTFAAFVATLRRIVDKHFLAIIIIFFPVVIITIVSGQNGFLTAVLIGSTVFCFRLAAPRLVCRLA
jgi:hypothetical protein